MEQEKMLILGLLVLSVAFWAIPIVGYLVKKLFTRPSRLPERSSGLSGVMVFSGCLILSVWCLRFAVGYFQTLYPDPENPPLTWWEEIFNSLVHAMQTFSMDEDYTKYIHDGKAMLAKLLGETSVWTDVYGLYAAILNFVAPVAGGAVIFEILASIFPALRLAVAQLAIWREKYYFSELNDASLELAKSICRIKRFFLIRPILIFTDAYVDGGQERSAELMMEAKRIGAICVRDDLAHVKKNKLGRKKLFLIDVIKEANLQTLTVLADTPNSKYLKRAEIYLFTKDDTYIPVERNLQKALRAKWKIKTDDDPRLPVIIPVRGHRNLITNMLCKVPLYEPLIGKERNTDGTRNLTVTILGAGQLGMEMLLNTYWIGQLPDCRLTINVVSQEAEVTFWDKLDYINPELRRTMQAGDPLLQVNAKGEMAPVYCTVNYIQEDMKSSAFLRRLDKDGPDTSLLDTDYFFVAPGSDDDSISIANIVRKYVGEYRLAQKSTQRTVIAYVVYSSEVADALNKNKRFSYFKDFHNIYMCAVGSRREVYSAETVFMYDYIDQANVAHNAYLSAKSREERAEKHRARLNNDYKYWASLARSMHIKYKMYALGMQNLSLFDVEDGQEAYHRLAQKKAWKDYEDFAFSRVSLPDQPAEDRHRSRLHEMAWLEHRRWNAFTRTVGFRKPEDYAQYAAMCGYKHMELKLHPCLVECDRKGIRAEIDAGGNIEKKKYPFFDQKQKEDLDMLDMLMDRLGRDGYIGEDVKRYDYPAGDFEKREPKCKKGINRILSTRKALFCRRSS